MEVPIPKKCLQVLFTWEKDNNNNAEVSLGVATEGESHYFNAILVLCRQMHCFEMLLWRWMFS